MCWGLPVVRLVLVYCKGSHKCYERVSMQALSKGYERSYPSSVVLRLRARVFAEGPRVYTCSVLMFLL